MTSAAQAFLMTGGLFCLSLSLFLLFGLPTGCGLTSQETQANFHSRDTARDTICGSA